MRDSRGLPLGAGRHRQVPVQLGNMDEDVDEEIAPLILNCWRLGIMTVQSCQDPDGHMLIEFADSSDAARFLDAVLAGAGEDLGARVLREPARLREAREDWTDWWGQAWSYDAHVIAPDSIAVQIAGKSIAGHSTRVAVSVGVRFPRGDLGGVAQHVAQAASSVWARSVNRAGAGVLSTDEEEWSYQCPDCGDERLLVQHQYTLTQHVRSTLACTCERGYGDVAAERRSSQVIYVTEGGWLDDEHRVDWDKDATETEQGEEEEDFAEVYCDACASAAREGDWVIEADPDDAETVDDDYAVVCGGCGREIEFGWSNPDRGGCIWPAECSASNPWNTWPEPRFRDSWAAKGWIPPEFSPRTAQP